MPCRRCLCGPSPSVQRPFLIRSKSGARRGRQLHKMGFDKTPLNNIAQFAEKRKWKPPTFYAASTFLRFLHIPCRSYRRFPLRPGRKPCPQILEKRLQQLLCFLCAQPLLHHRVVVEGHCKQVGHTAAAARLGVCRAVYHPPDAAVDDGPGAHGARLQRDEQLALPQPPTAQLFAGGINGQQLCMMQGVFFGLAGVVGGSYHLAVAGHHGPHRHLAQCSRLAGFFQRKAHQFRIGHRFPFILLQKPADYSMYAKASPAIPCRCVHEVRPAQGRSQAPTPCPPGCRAAPQTIPPAAPRPAICPRAAPAAGWHRGTPVPPRQVQRCSGAQNSAPAHPTPGQAEMPALCLPAGMPVRSRTQPAAPLFLPFAPWPALPAVRFSAPILS